MEDNSESSTDGRVRNNSQLNKQRDGWIDPFKMGGMSTYLDYPGTAEAPGSSGSLRALSRTPRPSREEKYVAIGIDFGTT